MSRESCDAMLPVLPAALEGLNRPVYVDCVPLGAFSDGIEDNLICQERLAHGTNGVSNSWQGLMMKSRSVLRHRSCHRRFGSCHTYVRFQVSLIRAARLSRRLPVCSHGIIPARNVICCRNSANIGSVRARARPPVDAPKPSPEITGSKPEMVGSQRQMPLVPGNAQLPLVTFASSQVSLKGEVRARCPMCHPT